MTRPTLSATTVVQLHTTFDAVVNAIRAEGFTSRPSATPRGMTMLRPIGNVALEVTVVEGEVKGQPGVVPWLRLSATVPRVLWKSEAAQQAALIDVVSHYQGWVYEQISRYEKWRAEKGHSMDLM